MGSYWSIVCSISRDWLKKDFKKAIAKAGTPEDLKNSAKGLIIN